MHPQVKEYEITYGVKLYLLEKGWDVIAYNPPGSQGTFTIPNPSKDGTYRGQTGSESPDVIAIKKNHVLVVECKPSFDVEDTRKLERLSKNKAKLEILDLLIRRVCNANEIKISGPLTYLYSLAYAGSKHDNGDLGFFQVSVSKDFNVTKIEAIDDYSALFRVDFFSGTNWPLSHKALFEN